MYHTEGEEDGRLEYLNITHATHTDVQFWRSRKSLEGLSVRSVFFNVFQSFIVLLYILDNETNKIIIISVFVGKEETHPSLMFCSP